MIFRCSGKSGYSDEISGNPQHVEARKLEREVEVRFTDVSCMVRTPEGVVHARPGDAILTGNGGHHWRVSHGKLLHKYRAIAPTVPGATGHYMSLPYHILALKMQAPFEVILADAVSKLTGHAGDWLVDYGDGSLGIVAHDIFSSTYEILS